LTAFIMPFRLSLIMVKGAMFVMLRSSLRVVRNRSQELVTLPQLDPLLLEKCSHLDQCSHLNQLDPNHKFATTTFSCLLVIQNLSKINQGENQHQHYLLGDQHYPLDKRLIHARVGIKGRRPCHAMASNFQILPSLSLSHIQLN
jgi:hypothetical protein